MDIPQILGWIATFLFSIMVIPQMVRTIRSKDTSGVSLLMFIIFFVANIIALIYAILIFQSPLIIKYIIALVTTAVYIILYGIFYYRSKRKTDYLRLVLLLTGLSGSGKTTIAKNLQERLDQLGKKSVIIDGDVVRSTINQHLGFSREDIRENNRRIAILAKEKAADSDFVLIPVIAPFKEDRVMARSIIGRNFLEIFVDAPIKVCGERDPKGLYKKAVAGEIKNFIGLSGGLPYETPENPDLHLKTHEASLEECVNKILNHTNLI